MKVSTYSLNIVAVEMLFESGPTSQLGAREPSYLSFIYSCCYPVSCRAMNGSVKFEDALAARLKIIQPSRQDIQECLKQHPPKFTPGIKKLMTTLQKKGIAIFLVSGGFRLMIEPIAEQVGIPLYNIYANTIFFDDDGNYNGFDDAELTSRDGGKAKAIEVIKRIHGYEKIAMVGDGVTDLQARPPADLFVGFGGIVTRDVVKENADLFVTDFDHLTKLLQ
ncbi:hypothetical protein PsorP6_008457 [Peronosclerospora sorghi]|uniref:Uncharacterized protein n=1 Tax=Peronosclerospora sorghi TaxID=230839 RepID=A0ACC0WCT9_9STRA|nr:hypothetical protein PsorP6_008457 [Peronosclerospora sorghi]